MSTSGKKAHGDGGGQPDSSNSAGVSSLSPSDLTKCSECYSEGSEDSVECPAVVVFCLQCCAPLCALCNIDVHKSRTAAKHKRMPIGEYLKLQNTFNTSQLTAGEMEKDDDNKFCSFSPIEHRILLLPRLASLVKDPQARPSLVSFIGPTGVGKSTLIRLLVNLDGGADVNQMPLAGAPNDAQSTSADIHIYLGGQIANDSPAQSAIKSSTYPVLYMDSEGQGGSKEPLHIERSWNNVQKFLNGKLGNYEEFQNKRSEHVQVSYPRMLYIFSDVLCFVFSGNWRERDAIITPLLSWGKSAAVGAVNQHRPQLVLIFNKQGSECEGAEYDDFRMTSETWFKGDKNRNLEELKKYYLDPLVVVIPHNDISADTVYKRGEMLREVIMKSTTSVRLLRDQRNQLFTRRQLQLYMQLAAETFSKNPKDEFDIYKATMARRPTSVGLAGYIVEFRRAVAEEAIKNEMSKVEAYELSLRILQKRIKVSVRLWMDRLKVDLGLWGANCQLPPDLRRALEQAQADIDGEQPCGGFHEDYYRCGKVQLMHANDNMHVSEESNNFRWEGPFCMDAKVQEAADACRLVKLAESSLGDKKTPELRQDRERLLKVRQSEVDRYGWLKDFICYRVCVMCMIELPTEVLSCGHIICAMCAKEEAEVHSRENFECPICRSSAKWYPNEVPRYAGYRILSLDGGGVKGIVELLLLERIMSFFPDMHVEDLFDVVVGTSTGGIIALALTVHDLDEQPKRLREVIKLFQDLCKEVFSKEMRRLGARFPIFLRVCQVFGVYDTKYKNDNLLMLLEKHINHGRKSLLHSCVGGPRVIITSCDPNSKLDAVWFTSYNRSVLENECDDLSQQASGRKHKQKSSCKLGGGRRVVDNYMFSAKDAAAATSAAGTYFPAYEAGGRVWVDGGMRYNCPADVAIQEAKHLWPERSASALVTLGCGKLSDLPPVNNSLFSQLTGALHVLTDAESESEKVITHLEDLYPGSNGCFLRINIEGTKEYKLDEAEKIPALISETKDYLDSDDGLASVHQAANVLFATYFYVDFEIDEDSEEAKLETLCIRSRGRLPLSLRQALIYASKSTSPPFTVIVTANEKEMNCAEATFNWAKCSWVDNVMSLPFNPNAPPMLGTPTILVKLHQLLPNTTEPGEWPLPISGMPCRLSAQSKRSNSRG